MRFSRMILAAVAALSAVVSAPVFGQTAVSAGHDANGFYVASNDGFRLNVGGDLQFAYTASLNREGQNADDQSGFSNPLTRLRFSGTVYNSLNFGVEADFNSADGQSGLNEAWASFRSLGGQVQFGQFKLPFLQETNIADRFQLSTTRSIVSNIFGQGYSQGIQYSNVFGNFQVAAAFSDGFNTANTEFNDPAEADYGVTGRLEYAFTGWENHNYTQFTSASADSLAVLAGVAGHYQDGDAEQGTLYSYTGDLTFKNAGWNAFASGVGRNIDTGNDSFDDYGLVFQGGYRFASEFEPFVRYDAVFADSARNLSNDSFSFATAGVNYYLHGQAAKFTFDVVYALDETTGLDTLCNFSNTGLLGSTDSGEIVAQFQFQLLF